MKELQEENLLSMLSISWELKESMKELQKENLSSILSVSWELKLFFFLRWREWFGSNWTRQKVDILGSTITLKISATFSFFFFFSLVARIVLAIASHDFQRLTMTSVWPVLKNPY